MIAIGDTIKSRANPDVFGIVKNEGTILHQEDAYVVMLTCPGYYGRTSFIAKGDAEKVCKQLTY